MKDQNDIFKQFIPGNTAFVDGGNFSGRSELLKQSVGIGSSKPIGLENASYIAPDLESALSGFCVSVEQELSLHTKNRSSPIQSNFLELLNLDKLKERNPATLSGGELARLVTACSIMSSAERIAIDCAWEQVDLETRASLFKYVSQGIEKKEILIADNRVGDIKNIFGNYWKAEEANSTCFKIDINCIDELDFQGIPLELTLSNISFGYTKKAPLVLNNLSCKLEPGKIYALNGKNGVGKTTLAKLMCGALKPKCGSIYFDNKLVKPWRTGNISFAYHFQNPNHSRIKLSAIEEIESFYVRFRQNSKKMSIPCNLKELTYKWLKIFGLISVADSSILSLPYVLKKRIDLCACFAVNAPWIILDEPTLGQDDNTVMMLAKIIKNRVERGLGVIIISHSKTLTSLLTVSHLELRNGSLSENGVPIK